jgi:4-hydroxy-tetrahydrodipicolinate reductase
MKQLNIIISGYGKMGREVEQVALQRGHKIIARLDNKTDWDLFLKSGKEGDVVIDFSMPEVALQNFERCFNAGLPLVTGTTGWYDKKERVFKMVVEKDAAFFYAPNFSIGVNIFFYINRKLAEVMNGVEGYQVSMRETHHIHKLDSPSGTAIQLADDIVERMDNISGWSSGKAKEKKIPIISVRKGEVTGIHEVMWKSESDEILLKHQAKSRKGFALGAVLAAEFLPNKKGVYTMDDLLNFKEK